MTITLHPGRVPLADLARFYREGASARVPPLDGDRFMTGDLAGALVADGTLTASVPGALLPAL